MRMESCFFGLGCEGKPAMAKKSKNTGMSARKGRPEGYPKPRAIGGKLIREVIGHLRAHGIELPIASHILIAASAGADSMALAHLLVHYGRRVGARSNIALLHVNHGWRGKHSDADAEFVKQAAKKWRVPFHQFRLKPPRQGEGQSWEDEARAGRKRIFIREAKKHRALVLTAHHADDLAETVLWRVLTGSHETHGGGIAVKHGVEVRPFLRIRKETLKEYLKEEGESWREDATNQDLRFLRARIRAEVMPAIERVFPNAVERLVSLGLQAQAPEKKRAAPSSSDETIQALETLLGSAGLRVRRAHWEELDSWSEDAPFKRELHLSGGWRLVHEPADHRWILEKRPVRNA